MVDKPILLPIVSHHTLEVDWNVSNPLQVQFLLDPSACPLVISSVQEMGAGLLSDLLYMTRTWCHAHHVKRKRLLKLHNII